jgi:proline iminopeptidase
MIMTMKEEGYVPVSGGRVWYWKAGSHAKGIPLVVVHGGPGASHDYLEPLEAFASERPVVFYDQLGCGNSDRPDDNSLWVIERFVDELHQIREALGLGQVHLLGQSWGASLVAEYMLTKQPVGVAGLLLAGPLLSTSRWMEDQRKWVSDLPVNVQEIIRRTEDSGDFASKEYQEAMMVFYGRHVCRMEQWPECLNRTFEKLNLSQYLHMWGPSEFTVTGTLKTFELADRLGELKLPVLITCGQFDEARPETCRYFQSLVPGAELHVFEDASHEHHLEKPDEFLAVAGNFFRKAEQNTL